MSDDDNGLVTITESFIRPSPEYPHGSYLRKIGSRVDVATGYYATLYPGHPSPYFHGGAPFVMLDTKDIEDRNLKGN